MNDIENLQLAAREGDRLSLSVWADALEEAADAEAVAAVRAVPEVLAAVRSGIQCWVAGGCRAWKVSVTLDEAGGWDTVPLQTNSNDLLPEARAPGRRARSYVRWDEHSGEHDAIRVLLRRWDELHPAVEYIARQLELFVVELAFAEASDHPGPPGVYRLRRQRLRPLPGGRVSRAVLRRPRSRSAHREPEDPPPRVASPKLRRSVLNEEGKQRAR